MIIREARARPGMVVTGIMQHGNGCWAVLLPVAAIRTALTLAKASNGPEPIRIAGVTVVLLEISPGQVAP